MDIGKRVQLGNLESKLNSLMRDLERVRKQVKELTFSVCGLSVYLDEKTPQDKRKKASMEIVSGAYEITKSKRPIMNIADDDKRVDMSCFSKEFKELEMEAVKVRAQITALKNGVGIKKFETLEPIGRLPDTRLSPIGIAKNWEEVREMVQILFNNNCIRYSAAITPDKVHKGQWVAKRLKEVIPSGIQDEISRQIDISPSLQAELSGESEECGDVRGEISIQIEVPPDLKGEPTERLSQMEIPYNILSRFSNTKTQLNPEEGIPMLISELRAPDGSIQQQLVAIKAEKE